MFKVNLSICDFWPCILSETWDSGTLITHKWGTFDLAVFNIIWRYSVYLSQMTKTAVRRVKWTGVWESGTLVTHIWSTFHLVVFKVILGSFIQYTCLKMAYNSKMAGRRTE